MKRRSFWLGAVLAAILLCLAVVLVLSPWDTPSLAEQIAADQDLPAGSVTLLSEGTLTQGQEQAVGFFDHQGRPGLALVSKEEPGRLLRVESASSFSSRVPAVWVTYLSLGGGELRGSPQPQPQLHLPEGPPGGGDVAGNPRAPAAGHGLLCPGGAQRGGVPAV